MIVVVMIVTLSASAGSIAGPAAAPSGARRSVRRAIANIPNGATIARYSRPFGHVVVVHVAELVGDDEAQLVAREVLDQRVVEHDALGLAEARDVRVGGGRAAAGVGLVDLADVDARLARELEHVGAHLARRQRRELVEQRVEHDRAGVDRDHAERDDDGRSGDPPAPREAADQRHAAGRAGARDQRADAPRDRDVARVAAPRLRDQAVVARALAADDLQRQRRRPRPSPTARRRSPPRPAAGGETGRPAGAAGAPRAARAHRSG